MTATPDGRAPSPRDRIQRAAIISQCGAYRYRLSRSWDIALPTLLFVMLNPSTADALADDPTIRRCISFAIAHDFGGIEVVNLFAYRATDPRELRLMGLPEGPENDQHIRDAAMRAGAVCVAWGAVPFADDRIQVVMPILREAGAADPRCLHITRSGYPGHPLYLAGNKRLRAFDSLAIQMAMEGLSHVQ